MASPILNPNLRGFFESNHRYYVLYGGRSSGKTYHTAGFCVFLASQYKVKFLCVRQFQARISDSVKSTIEECIDLCGMRDEFKITENSIEHKYTGSTFSFLGINRNLNEIKGLSGIEVLWIEEAEALTEEQWRVIMPTVRAEGSKIFIVFNPRLHTDFCYKNFVVDPPENSIVRKINYDENPYLSNTMRKVIEDAQNDDDFDHVYLGEPRTTDDESIIQRKHIMAAIDAHIKLGIEPSGTTKIGYDVADAGEDSCATVSFKGALATDLDLWKAKEDELLKSCSRVHARARQEKALIVYDAIGVGASCGAKFNELNAQSTQRKVLHQKFFAGGAPAKPDRQYKQTGISNRDFFSNIKAQAWWITADRFMNTYNAVTNGQQFPESDMIFIDSKIPHLEQLIDELVTPKRDYDLAGRVKVESKKDLAKRDIKSPNIADAFVMVSGNMDAAPMQINPNILR